MSLPTLMDLVRRSVDYLTQRGIENARRETEWIFAESLRLSRLELYTRFDMPLDDAQVGRLRELVQRRGRREPLAYVLGSQAFCDLTLVVGPGVLVPRPETEELVEYALTLFPTEAAVQVLDVGTGSGAIALGIKHARRHWLVSATDVSTAALQFARSNAMRSDLTIEWREDHLATRTLEPVDLVVANLPYIGEGEREHCDPELAFEPASALFADDGGLALISELITDLPRILKRGGHALFEHGWQQGAAVRTLGERRGFDVSTVQDGAGRDRFAHMRWPA